MEEILEINLPTHNHCRILPSAEWKEQWEWRRNSEYGPKSADFLLCEVYLLIFFVTIPSLCVPVLFRRVCRFFFVTAQLPIVAERVEFHADTSRA